jgi:hypothetical protein
MLALTEKDFAQMQVELLEISLDKFPGVDSTAQIA